ncbi:MAG: hypothetical protein IH886_11830 [Nitrospinae bacterium]|nr:hypothetical protein [Nitrospinota bacterium]
MVDGIYQITFRGAADWGVGMLILKDGTVTGADVGGVLYDGTYTDQGSKISVNLALTVPPGVTLVQGAPPQSKEYKFDFKLSLDKKVIETKEPVLVQTPQGPVNVIFNRLRNL